MTFPSVRSSATTTSTNGTATLPATVVAGDLLLVVSQANVSAQWSSTPNYTLKLEVAFNPRLFVHARVATANSSDNIAWTPSATNGWAFVVMAIQDWEGTLDGVEGQGIVDSVNPPSLTPSWGSTETLWLEICGMGGGSTLPTVTAWSTNYTEVAKITGDFTHDVFAGAAQRLLEATSEDPDAITVTAGDSVRSGTLAVRPSGAAAIPEVSATLAVAVDLDGTLSVPTATVAQLTSTLAVATNLTGTLDSPTATVPALTSTLAVEVDLGGVVADPGATIPTMTASLAVETDLSGTLDAPTASVPQIGAPLAVEVDLGGAAAPPSATVAAVVSSLNIAVDFGGTLNVPTPSVAGLTGSLALEVDLAGVVAVPAATVSEVTGALAVEVDFGGTLLDPDLPWYTSDPIGWVPDAVAWTPKR